MEQNLERLILPSSKFLQGASEGNVLQSPVFRIGFKRTISETLDMCAAIRNRRASLASAVHDDLFDRNVIEINRIKMDINANMRCLRDISLKKYLSERISKRRRQKLNRAKRAIDKTNSRLSIIKQTTEINNWVRESANARNEKRKVIWILSSTTN